MPLSRWFALCSTPCVRATARVTARVTAWGAVCLLAATGLAGRPAVAQTLGASAVPGAHTADANAPDTTDVHAADVDALRNALRIDVPDGVVIASPRRTRGFPGSTVSTPTAFGPGWGQLYAGAAYQDRIRYDDFRDGILTFGFGLGDPQRYAGLDVTVNILDTTDEFARDRSLSLKLHRRLPGRTAVAVGYENLWHTSGTDGGSSRYAVASGIVPLRSDLGAPFGSAVVSLGVGDDRFQSEERFLRRETGVGVFGSAAVRVLRPVNAIANWTGQDLNLGLSVAPVPRWPVVVTPALVDVTGRAGDGVRFAVSASVGYNLLQ